MPKKTKPKSSAGAALAAIRWIGHTKEPWKPIKLRESTLIRLRAHAARHALTIDGAVSGLLKADRWTNGMSDEAR